MRLTPLLLIAPACLTLTLAPLAAQQTPPADDFASDLIEEGAKMLLRGLLSEAGPMLDEMEQALREMEPGLREIGPRLKLLVDLMGDVANYEAPERLPNGDILIRRKRGAPPAPALPLSRPEALDQNGEIEL